MFNMDIVRLFCVGKIGNVDCSYVIGCGSGISVIICKNFIWFRDGYKLIFSLLFFEMIKWWLSIL